MFPGTPGEASQESNWRDRVEDDDSWVMPFHPQPLFYLVVGLVCGTLVPGSEPGPPLALALALAVFVCITAIVRPGQVTLTALVVAAAAAGATLANLARGEYDRLHLPWAIADVAGVVILEGRLVSDPKVVDDEMRFELRSSRIVAEGKTLVYEGSIRVYVRSQSTPPFDSVQRLSKGDTVSAWVELRRPQPVRSPGGFDQLAWARRERVHAFATCKADRLIRITSTDPPSRNWIDGMRDRLKWSWRHVEDPLSRAVTASMVLGDEGALDVDTREDFRSSGLLHLLVVSGSQVAALVIGLRRLMPRPLRLSWPGCALECLALLAYCLLAGAEDSIVRATAMAVAFAVGVRVDLQRGGANFLALAALVILATRPLDALDPGLQLSFAATLALVTWAGFVTHFLQRARLPGLLADILAATLVASVAVVPLTLIHFHRFTLVALPANLLAAPLAVALLYGSLVTAALDLVFAPLASIAGAVCGLIAESLRTLAHHAATADPDWRGPGPPLALLAGLVGAAASSGARRLVLPLAGLLASLTLSGLPKGDGRLHLWFLDVGQGDALILETPGGRVAVVDAGPFFGTFDAGERVVAEALWDLGHRRIDLLAVTHRHADHEGGAPFLIRHFRPARIFTNGPSDGTMSSVTRIVETGHAWTLDGILFRVLGPGPPRDSRGSDENARSLILEVRHGASTFLLMGDAGRLDEQRLDLGGRRYDVVKVGHHGAATSSSHHLVSETRARIALISVGSRNRFSHPAPRVVERWSRAGALVWRTDWLGTLHVTSDGTRLSW